MHGGRSIRIRLVLATLAALGVVAVLPSVAAAVTPCQPPSTGDTQPDAAGGRDVHIIYAFPSDATDNSATRVPQIATDIEFIDAWWVGQDKTRLVRWDTLPQGTCPSRYGALDISSVRLPNTSAAYKAMDGEQRLSALARDLDGMGFGKAWKKYLLLFDGPVDNSGICGISPLLAFSGGLFSYSTIYMQDSLCGLPFGTGRGGASTMAHELVHNLGALPPGAPHPCGADTGHPCDNQADLMWPFIYDSQTPLSSLVLDVNHDDYYAHSGNWWDVQDSGWLRHIGAEATLQVNASDKASVHILEPASGFTTDCTTECKSDWDTGSQVQLTASSPTGLVFRGWQGSCTGTAIVCALTIDGAKTATPIFAARVSLQVRVTGGGRVESRIDGFRCKRTCQRTLYSGDQVSLRAVALKGWKFAGWSGSCRAKKACVFTAGEADLSVGAKFTKLPVKKKR